MNMVGHFSRYSLIAFLRLDTDNLQVQWGSQDHYEIVRKVGRGKYSEVRVVCPNLVGVYCNILPR